MSGMCKNFPRGGGRRVKLFSGIHVKTLARFKGEIRLGRPSFASLRDKNQLKFTL
jgi:hypothetical protein